MTLYHGVSLGGLRLGERSKSAGSSVSPSPTIPARGWSVSIRSGALRRLLWRVGIALPIVAIAGLLGGFALVVSRMSATTHAVNQQATRLVEPPLAATYLSAFARHDVVGADEVASPLNQWEWTRRGLVLDPHLSLFPRHGGASTSGSWIHFSYIGGTRDARGFGRLLYIAQPDTVGQPTFPSAWRVDTDPSGRVIWAELVFLFEADSTAIATVPGTNDILSVSLPQEIAMMHPRLVAGVHVPNAREGYYLLSVPATATGSTQPKLPDTLLFVGVDEEGLARPGVWSYGQENSGPSRYGQEPTQLTVPSDPSVAAMLTSYFETP